MLIKQISPIVRKLSHELHLQTFYVLNHSIETQKLFEKQHQK